MSSAPTPRRFWIADAHADSLMWNRDLNVAGKGHVDFPRLMEAGVRIQCFTLVTHGYPFVDGFPLFATWRGWPAAARANAWTRALFQIDQLEAFCAASKGAAELVRTRDELDAAFEAGRLCAVLGVEGAQVVMGEPARVAELRRRGVCFMGLTHLSNNALGGSSSPGMRNRPLTPLGRDVLDAMVAHGMAVDVAHASARTLADVLAHPRARPFCSHTGMAALSRPWRNLPDAALKAIADKGGVVGVIFAPIYLGGGTLADVARHVRHAVDVMGEEGVALGSDFDGMVPLPKGMRDVRDVPKLLQALLAAGLYEAQVEKIAGENLRRFLKEVLGSGIHLGAVQTRLHPGLE